MTRTNAHTILCMMIRAFAAWATIELLMSIPAVLTTSPGFEALSTGERLFSVLAPLFVIVLMWFFPDYLAKVALARRSGEVFETDIDPKACLAVGLAVVAAVTIIDGIVESTRLLLMHLAFSRGEDGFSNYPVGFAAEVWTSAIGLLAGLALLLGSRGIASLIFRMRYGDLPAATAAGKSDATESP